jgi:hypothetical protein
VQIALDTSARVIRGGDDLARDAVSWARPSAFATAVATSSVNSFMRPSTPIGIRSGADQADAITPQRRPATTIGAPILE